MLKKFIKQAPLVLIYIVIGFLPLVFYFILPINSVFELTKSSFFYFFLSLLFSFTIVKIFYFGLYTLDFKNFKHRKELTLVVIYLLVFFLYLVFNALFIAESTDISIFGSYRRQQGLIFYISSFIFFVLVLYNLLINQKKRSEDIFLVMSLSGFLVSIFAIIQFLGLDNYTWQESLLADRVISSLGQANHLGAFILFSLAASLIYLKNKQWRYFIIISIFFQILTLYLSGSKSAWLGLIVALLIYLLLKLKERLSLKKILIITLALTVIFLLTNNQRFKDLLNTGSSSLRLSFYQTSLNSFIEKPLFAYGLEHSGSALIKGYRPDWAQFLQVNDYPDRAHNIFLEILLKYGLVGGLLLLVLIWALVDFFRLFKNKFNDQSLIIILALLAYFIFLLFNFASITSHVYFWLFIACLFYYSLDNEIILKRSELKRVYLCPIIICLLLFSYFCYNYSINKIQADRLFYKCKQSNNLDLCFLAINETSSISAKNYYSSFLYSSLVDNYLSYPKDLQSIVLTSLKDYYNSLDNNNDYHLKFKLACFLNNEEADSLFKHLVSLSPYRPAIYQSQADCHLRRGEFDLALGYYQQSLDLLPKKIEAGASFRFLSYLNFYRHWLHYSIAQTYFAKKDYNLAIENYRLSFYYYPYSQAVWASLIDTLYLKKQLDLAIKEALWAHNYWPNEAKWLNYLSHFNQEKSQLAD